MEDKHLKVISESVTYRGDIFEIISRKVLVGDQEKRFELAKRSPGTRLIIIKDGRLLLTREYRYEVDDYDYRLPGGKVFDSLADYHQVLENDQDVLLFAREAAIKEANEETGLVVKEIEHLETISAGATVIWDLFVFIVKDFVVDPVGQKLEEGEDIDVYWKTFEEVKEMCLKGEIKEDRIVGVLLKYLINNRLVK